MNWANIGENFIANLGADIIVAVIIGVYITNHINNSSAQKLKRKNLKIIVNMLWAEIRHNQNQLKLLIKHLPKSNLPYPALETAAWEVADRHLLLETLNEEDFSALLGIYNRAKTINETYYALLEKSAWVKDDPKPIIKKEFINNLVERCEELLQFINVNIPKPKLKE